jgi:hypothetical protein
MTTVTQQQAPAHRLNELDPFDDKTVEAERAMTAAYTGSAACCESLNGEREDESEYGCVDWYRYPERKAADAKDVGRFS